MPIGLSIVTPAGPFAELEVDSVVLPGEVGEFGVLPAHERFLTSLNAGVLEYVAAGERQRLNVSSGFAEVTGERVTVLVGTAEASSVPS